MMKLMYDERERLIIKTALSSLLSNVDDINEVMMFSEEDKITEDEVIHLIDTVHNT